MGCLGAVVLRRNDRRCHHGAGKGVPQVCRVGWSIKHPPLTRWVYRNNEARVGGL